MPSSQGWAGCWREGQDWDFIAFRPETLREILKEQGYEYEPIVRLWRDVGWLDTSHDKSRLTKSFKMQGENVRLIAIKREAFDEPLSSHEDAEDVMQRDY